MKNITNEIFITGTDTEIGKTFISQCVIESLKEKGKLTIGLKPIASGAQMIGDSLSNEDALKLQSCSSRLLEYAQVNPFCFEPAIAPHIAAQKVAQPLSVKLLQEKVIKPQADFVIIEGAGGWLTPLNETETFADWVELRTTQVILVVGMKLGCLNHAMLTVNDIKSRGLQLVGWVANFAQGEMAMAEENLSWLKNNIEAPCLAEVPFIKEGDFKKASKLLNLQTLL